MSSYNNLLQSTVVPSKYNALSVSQSFSLEEASFVRELATYGRALECLNPGFKNIKKNQEILSQYESHMARKLNVNIKTIRSAKVAMKTFNHWKLFTAQRTTGYVISRFENGNTNITLARLIQPKYYEERHDVKKTLAMPNSAAWEEVRNGLSPSSNFIDAHFPHDETSIHRDPVSKPCSKLKNIVKCWRRIRDIAAKFVRVSLDFCLDDDSFPACVKFRIGGQNESYSILPKEMKNRQMMPQISDQQTISNKIRLCLFQSCSTLLKAGLITRDAKELDTVTNGNSQGFFSNNVFEHLQAVYPDFIYSHITDDMTFVVEHTNEVNTYQVSLRAVFVANSGQDYPDLFNKSCYEECDGNDMGNHYQEQGATESINFDVFPPPPPLPPKLNHNQSSVAFVDCRDVKQGALGDCYLMGALSVLAAHPATLLQLFPKLGNGHHQRYNQEGIYAVRIYRGASCRVVIVDDYFPCDEYGDPCFAQLPVGGDFWCMIVEKAFAKIHGSYEGIIGGQTNAALQALMGGVPITIKLHEEEDNEVDDEKEENNSAAASPSLKKVISFSTSITSRLKISSSSRRRLQTENKVWNMLQEIDKLEKGKFFAGCSKLSDKSPEGYKQKRSQNILSNHAFGILKLDVIDQVKMVLLRNPWGGGKVWDGKFGPHDLKSWSKVSVQERKRIGMNGDLCKDDGMWWMTFSDFLGQMDEISICQHFSGYQVHHIVGEWSQDTAGGFEDPQLCPQFQVDMEKDGYLVVELRQRHPASVGSSTTASGNRNSSLLRNMGNNLSHSRKEKNDGLISESREEKDDVDWMRIAPLVLKHGTPGEKMVEFTGDLRVEGLNGMGEKGMAVRSNVVHALVKASDGPFTIVAIGNKGNQAVFYLDIYTSEQSKVIKMNDNLLPRDSVTGELLQGQITKIISTQDGSTNYVLSKNLQPAVCRQCYRRIEKKQKHFGVSEEVAGVTHDYSVHEACIELYRIKRSPKCIKCGLPISDVGGKFTGSSYSVDEGKVHEECFDQYKLEQAPKCIKCGLPISDVGGKFTGSSYSVDEGKVHEECFDQYKLEQAPKCIKCGLPISDVGGKFTGSSYSVDEGKVHEECFNKMSMIVLAHAPLQDRDSPPTFPPPPPGSLL